MAAFMAIILAFCFIALILWYRMRKDLLTTFEKMGIPGPKPYFLTGNLREIYRKGIGTCLLEWTEKYGSIVGIYFGPKPAIMVTDPDLINIIQVQEYANFNARALLTKNGCLLYRPTERSFVFKKDYKWKTYRSLISATISASKLKEMVKVWDAGFADYMEKFEVMLGEKGSEVNISDYIRFLTINNFLKSAYSASLEMDFDLKDPNFQSVARGAQVKFSDPLVALEFSFPELEELIYGFRILREKFRHYIPGMPSSYSLGKKIKKFIQLRQKGDAKVNPYDILQAILDMRFNLNEPNTYKKKTAISGKPGEIKSLSLEEIAGDTFFLLLAGFETTALTLSYLFHLLAHHQDVQEKLREEIRTKLGDKPISYDTLFGLEYMEQVINEVTRLYPATITFTTRISREEYTYKNYVFPKNSVFWIPNWALHHSPENWEDPEKFDPDRFSLERRGGISPTKFQPFGHGQRICYGQRFALHEIRAVTAEFLRRYKILLGPSSQPEKLELTDYLLFLMPNKKIHVKLVPLGEESTVK